MDRLATRSSLFRIRGMSCASCAARVTRALERLPGVVTVNVNLVAKTALVEYGSSIGIDEMIRAVAGAGYEMELEADSTEIASATGKEERQFPAMVVVALVLAATVMALGRGGDFPGKFYLLWVLATVVQFGAGWQFYRGAFVAARRGTMDMNTLIAMGTSAAYLYSIAAILFPAVLPAGGAAPVLYFDTSSMIIAVVLLGRFLEEKAKGRTSAAIEGLLALRPDRATVIREGIEQDVPVEQLRTGDMVLVRPGERVPADGLVRQGFTTVDEAMITGECLQVKKKVGDTVTGGSVNFTGAFQFEVLRVGRHSTLGRIVEIVRQAQGSRAPVQRIADTVAGSFVPVVAGMALVARRSETLSTPCPSEFRGYSLRCLPLRPGAGDTNRHRRWPRKRSGKRSPGSPRRGSRNIVPSWLRAAG